MQEAERVQARCGVRPGPTGSRGGAARPCCDRRLGPGDGGPALPDATGHIIELEFLIAVPGHQTGLPCERQAMAHLVLAAVRAAFARNVCYCAAGIYNHTVGARGRPKVQDGVKVPARKRR
jgi:hypothetical protein